MAGARFRGLDGLRGVAAITVMLFHCNNYFRQGPIFMHGFLAVDLFMILSGFVITLTYEERLSGKMSGLAFLGRRAHRLIPTYWIAAAIGIPIFWITTAMGRAHGVYSSGMIWLGVPLATIFLIPLWGQGVGMYPVSGDVAWSLVVEWFANILYAAGVHRWPAKVLCICAVVGWALMAFLGYFTGKGWCVGTVASQLFTLGVIRCLPSFLAGVVIYRLHRHPVFDRLPVLGTELLLSLWFVIAVIPTPDATPTVDWMIAIFANPLLVCLLIRAERNAPNYCSVLGEISYPLYVVHAPIIILGSMLPAVGMRHGPNPIGAFVSVTCALAVAWGIAKLAPKLPGLNAAVRLAAAAPTSP